MDGVNKFSLNCGSPARIHPQKKKRKLSNRRKKKEESGGGGGRYFGTLPVFEQILCFINMLRDTEYRKENWRKKKQKERGRRRGGGAEINENRCRDDTRWYFLLFLPSYFWRWNVEGRVSGAFKWRNKSLDESVLIADARLFNYVRCRRRDADQPYFILNYRLLPDIPFLVIYIDIINNWVIYLRGNKLSKDFVWLLCLSRPHWRQSILVLFLYVCLSVCLSLSLSLSLSVLNILCFVLYFLSFDTVSCEIMSVWNDHRARRHWLDPPVEPDSNDPGMDSFDWRRWWWRWKDSH